MKKNGFSLIELLGVIVVLALIALIATPIVMNFIEDSKKGTAERSAYNYIDTVKKTATSKRISGVILEGQYDIQEDGGLCPSKTGCGKDNVYKIKVDMNGNKPTSGRVTISDGAVTSQSMMKVGDYTIRYDTNEKEFKAADTESVICSLAADSKKVGTEIGAKYTCNLGDGVERTFYVLEDSATTTLKNIDTTVTNCEWREFGNVDEGKVSLIMDSNIDSATIKWCESSSSNSCNASTAKEYLANKTSNWSVEASMPTAEQLKVVMKNEAITKDHWLVKNIPSDQIYGYWTSTAFCGGNGKEAQMMYHAGTILNYSMTNSFGIRPIISLRYDQLG